MCFVRATKRRSKRPGGRPRKGTGSENGWKFTGRQEVRKEGAGEEEEQEEGRCRLSFSIKGGEGRGRGREGSEERLGGM